MTGEMVGDRITAHECRHTCASWLDAAGVRPVLVSQLMGHAAPARQAGAAQITQARYTHALPGELEQARDQFDGWLVVAADRAAVNSLKISVSGPEAVCSEYRPTGERHEGVLR